MIKPLQLFAVLVLSLTFLIPGIASAAPGNRIFITHEGAGKSSLFKNGAVNAPWLSPFSSDGRRPRVAGDRIAYMNGDKLWVKQGDQGQWTMVADQVFLYDISQNRIAIVFVGTPTKLYVKEGAITAPYASGLQADNIVDVYVTDNRLAVLGGSTSNELRVKEGSLASGWVTMRDSPSTGSQASVALEGDRVAYSASDGSVYIKEGSIRGPWNTLWNSTGPFYGIRMSGYRICIATSYGGNTHIFCKEGVVGAPWKVVRSDKVFAGYSSGLHNTFWDITPNRVALMTYPIGTFGGGGGPSGMASVWIMEGTLANNSGWTLLDNTNTYTDVALQR